MPREIMPVALQQTAVAIVETVFERQLQTAEYETIQTTSASSHNGVLRALQKAGISADLPIVQIIAKIRATNMEDPSLLNLCTDWESYRQKLFAANSQVLRQVSASIEKDAYDKVLGKITFDNCFTNNLWASRKIDLREEQFPTMNGDNIDQFNESLERDSKIHSKQLSWHSEAPALLDEIRRYCLALLDSRRVKALVSRAQQFISMHWEPAFKAIDAVYRDKASRIEQSASNSCLPSLSPDVSLTGLIDKFKASWVRLFNNGNCTYAQVQAFIGSQTTEVHRLKEENEQSLRETNYTLMQHDYTCAVSIQEWLVVARDMTSDTIAALNKFWAGSADAPRVIKQLMGTDIFKNASRTSSGSVQFTGMVNSLQDLVAKLEHKQLAFVERINQAQSNLDKVNVLTEVRRQAFQKAVLLDYATFVFHVIQLLGSLQAEFKDSLAAMDSGKAPAAGEVKSDSKSADHSAADRDRMYLDEYNRYITRLRAILGLEHTDGKRQPQAAAPDTTSIDTLTAQEKMQNAASLRALETNRRDAHLILKDVLAPIEAVNKEFESMKRFLNQQGWASVVIGMLVEHKTQVKGWATWKVPPETAGQMADLAMKLFHYVDHVRRVFPSAFAGMQSELGLLERATIDASVQAAADLGLSFKRVKMMSQPKETTAIGNMLLSAAPKASSESKDEWESMPKPRNIESGTDITTMLASFGSWIEIATICTLYKDSNTEAAMEVRQPERLGNESGSSRKRKMPMQLPLFE